MEDSQAVVERGKRIKLTNSFSSPRYSTLMYGLPPLLKTLKGKCLISDWTSASSNLRPIKRLASKTLQKSLVSLNEESDV
jgi:hypothetical protein